MIRIEQLLMSELTKSREREKHNHSPALIASLMVYSDYGSAVNDIYLVITLKKLNILKKKQ